MFHDWFIETGAIGGLGALALLGTAYVIRFRTWR